MTGFLSVVIPSYNEEEMIAKTAAVTGGILREAAIPHELIFVDDGSKDATWEQIEAISGQAKGFTRPCGGESQDSVSDGTEPSRASASGAVQSAVRGIRLSRNFGKESAIIAGLTKACGDCCVVIDCDLQHPPEKIVEMYRLWQEGYEIIEGRKSDRGRENRTYSLAARIFYRAISRATGIDMVNASDFKLLDRRAVDVLIHMRERNSFFRALSSWIGFRTTYVEFTVREREAGESKWSAKSLFRYAVQNITSFTAAPMQIVTVLGVIMLVISIILGVNALVQKFSGIALEGFTTVILIQLFSASIIMISLGIIGSYIARIYEEVKGRPKYIIAQTCGEKTPDDGKNRRT